MSKYFWLLNLFFLSILFLKSLKRGSGIWMFLVWNSSNISSSVNVQSTIPSLHWSTQRPHPLFPLMTPLKIFECLVIGISPFLYSPFSSFLKQNFPSSPSTSNLVSTIEPQNFKIPLLYPCKKKVNISLKLLEYLCSFLWLLLPICSFLSSILSSFVSLWLLSFCPLVLSFS